MLLHIVVIHPVKSMEVLKVQDVTRIIIYLKQTMFLRYIVLQLFFINSLCYL